MRRAAEARFELAKMIDLGAQTGEDRRAPWVILLDVLARFDSAAQRSGWPGNAEILDRCAKLAIMILNQKSYQDWVGKDDDDGTVQVDEIVERALESIKHVVTELLAAGAFGPVERRDWWSWSMDAVAAGVLGNPVPEPPTTVRRGEAEPAPAALAPAPECPSDPPPVDHEQRGADPSYVSGERKPMQDAEIIEHRDPDPAPAGVAVYGGTDRGSGGGDQGVTYDGSGEASYASAEPEITPTERIRWISDDDDDPAAEEAERWAEIVNDRRGSVWARAAVPPVESVPPPH